MCSFHACYSCVLQFTSPTLTPTLISTLRVSRAFEIYVNDPVLSDSSYFTYTHTPSTRRNARDSLHPPIRNTLTLSISHLVSTRKPSHLSAQHPSKTHNKLYMRLLLMMHDIELNPGPRSPKFPCGICHKAVTSNQCGVACDTCTIWHHTTCIHMS